MAVAGIVLLQCYKLSYLVIQSPLDYKKDAINSFATVIATLIRIECVHSGE